MICEHKALTVNQITNNYGGMKMLKIAGMILLVAGFSTFAFGIEPVAPEISLGSAGSGLAVLSGALLMIRARKKK
jgi:hypothetical protein